MAARQWQHRRRRSVVSAAAALVVVGAFLLWGPIGLGNGPLALRENDTTGAVAQSQGPVSFIIPLFNSGHSRAVIDELELVGGTKYAGPRLLRLAVLTTARCGGTWPAQPSEHGFGIGCGGHYHGALIGRTIGFTFTGPVPAAAEVAGPPPGGCWVMTEVVIHYHVGVRHYAATDPDALAVCGKDASAQVTAAMDASEASGRAGSVTRRLR